jgi:hypothetical protein
MQMEAARTSETLMTLITAEAEVIYLNYNFSKF